MFPSDVFINKQIKKIIDHDLKYPINEISDLSSPIKRKKINIQNSRKNPMSKAIFSF
jgi:hypothetical protein